MDNQNTMNRTGDQTHGKFNFKCSDVGPKNCDWQTSGNSEDEVMQKQNVTAKKRITFPLTPTLKARCRTPFTGKRHSTAFYADQAAFGSPFSYLTG